MKPGHLGAALVLAGVAASPAAAGPAPAEVRPRATVSDVRGRVFEAAVANG